MARQLIAKRTITPAAGDFASTQTFIGLLRFFGGISLFAAFIAVFIGGAGLDKGRDQGGPELLAAAGTLFAIGIGSGLGCYISAEVLRLLMRAVIALERIAPIGSKSSGVPATTAAPLPPPPSQATKPLPPLP
jgi:hypothetical protein